MFGIQTKSIRHAKRQENTTQDEEKNQLVQTDPERIQMIKFIYNNISKELLWLYSISQEAIGKIQHDN